MRWVEAFLLALLLMHAVTAADPIDLTAEQFYGKIQDGECDAVIDVRRLDEWNLGHIDGAFFVESLASYSVGDSMMGGSMDSGSPDDLKGCEYCSICVYCRSGNRAGGAIQVLISSGFKGQLYNGQGINQWQEAGYQLVTTASVPPPCTQNQTVSDQCKAAYDAKGDDDDDDNTSSAIAAGFSFFSALLLVVACSFFM